MKRLLAVLILSACTAVSAQTRGGTVRPLTNLMNACGSDVAASAYCGGYEKTFCAAPGSQTIYWCNPDTSAWMGIASYGGGAGLSDGDKGVITVASGGTVWTLDADTVGATQIATGALTAADAAADMATQAEIDLKAPLASPTFSGTVSIPSPFTVGSVSVLPTGTELNYVDGVTSAIQTQLDLKQLGDADLSAIAALTCADGLPLEKSGGVWACGTDNTGGGGLSDADYTDITVSGGGTVMNIDGDAVGAPEIAAGAVGTSEIATGGVDLATADVTGVLPDANVAGTIARDSELPSGADPAGHTHTTSSVSGLDISADTNLAVTAPITLTGDSVGMVNQGATTTVLHGNAAGNPSFSGVVSADITDGTIVSADLSGTAGITDAQVSDTLTASNLVGSGSSSNAVDLGTAEVAGDLALSNLAQSSAASRLMGRGSASGAGDFQEITLGTGLSMSGTTLNATASGAGDVVGPVTATDNAIARYDGTTGELIQDSGVLISDTGAITSADQTAEPGNGLLINDNDTAFTNDPTCANSGAAGFFSILDVDESSTDNWQFCNGTSIFADIVETGSDVITNAQILVGTGTGTGAYVTMGTDATIDNAGAVTVADDSHAHTTTTISGLDISADTNLGGTTPVVISGDNVTCPTCTTNAAALTSNAVVIGGGSQAASTISASTTTTHALFATATAPAFRAVADGDLPTALTRDTEATGVYGAANRTNFVTRTNTGASVAWSTFASGTADADHYKRFDPSDAANESGIVWSSKYQVYLGLRNGATRLFIFPADFVSFAASTIKSVDLGTVDLDAGGGSCTDAAIDSEGITLTSPDSDLFYVSTEANNGGSCFGIVEYSIAAALTAGATLEENRAWRIDNLNGGTCTPSDQNNGFESVAFVPDGVNCPNEYTTIPCGLFYAGCQQDDNVFKVLLDTSSGTSTSTLIGSVFTSPCGLDYAGGMGTDYDWKSGLLWTTVGSSGEVFTPDGTCVQTITSLPVTDAEGFAFGPGNQVVFGDDGAGYWHVSYLNEGGAFGGWNEAGTGQLKPRVDCAATTDPKAEGETCWDIDNDAVHVWDGSADHTLLDYGTGLSLDGTAQTQSAAKTVTQGSGVNISFYKTANSGTTDGHLLGFNSASGNAKRWVLGQAGTQSRHIFSTWSGSAGSEVERTHVDGLGILQGYDGTNQGAVPNLLSTGAAATWTGAHIFTNASPLTFIDAGGSATDADKTLFTYNRSSTDPWFKWDEQSDQDAWALNAPLDLRQIDTGIVGFNGDGDGFGENRRVVMLPHRGGIYSTMQDGTTLGHVIGVGHDSAIDSGTCGGTYCDWLEVGGSNYQFISMKMGQLAAGSIWNYGLDLIGSDIQDVHDVGNKVAQSNTRLVQWSVQRDLYTSIATSSAENNAGRCPANNAYTEANYECKATNRLKFSGGSEVSDIGLGKARITGDGSDTVEFAGQTYNATSFSFSDRATENRCSYAGMATGSSVCSYGSGCTDPTANLTITQSDTAFDHGWGSGGASAKLAFAANNNFSSAFFDVKCGATAGAGDRVAVRMWVRTDVAQAAGRHRLYVERGAGSWTPAQDTYAPPISANEWQEWRYQTTPSESSATVFPQIHRQATGATNASNIWVDDIQMEIIPGTVISNTAIASNAVTISSGSTLKTGARVTYITTGSAISGLTDTTDYYVIRLTATTASLASSLVNAYAGTAVAISGTPAATTHYLTPYANPGPWVPTGSAAVTLAAGPRVKLPSSNDTFGSVVASANSTTSGPAAWALNGVSCNSACNSIGMVNCVDSEPLDGTNTATGNCTDTTGTRVCLCY